MQYFQDFIFNKKSNNLPWPSENYAWLCTQVKGYIIAITKNSIKYQIWSYARDSTKRRKKD